MSDTTIIDEIIRLAQAFAKRIDAKECAEFRSAIGAITPAQMKLAVDRWMKNGKRFPRPIELARMIDTESQKSRNGSAHSQSAPGFVCTACGVVVACSAMESHGLSCEWVQRKAMGYAPVDQQEVYLRGLYAISPTKERSQALSDYRNSRSQK